MTPPATESEATRTLFRGLAGAALFTAGLYLAFNAAKTAMFLPDMPLAGDARGAAFLSMIGGAALAFLGWRLGMPSGDRADAAQAVTTPKPKPEMAREPEPDPEPDPEPARKKTFPPPAPSGEPVEWRWEGKQAPPSHPEPSMPDIEPPQPPLPPKRGMPWTGDELEEQA